MGQRDAKTCPWFVAGIAHNGVELEAGAARTVVKGENGRLFLCTGAVDFTLPAIAECRPGTRFLFAQQTDNNMVITSPEGNNIIAIGDAAATTVTFSTASEKIGSVAVVECVDTDGGGTKKWLLQNVGGTTPTPA